MRSAVSTLIALALLLLPSTGQAQEAAGYLQVYTIEVEPGANAQFEDFARKINEGATSAPGIVLTYQRAIGGSTNTYYIVRPFSEWADLDGWSTPARTLINAHGTEEGARILREGGETIASVVITVGRTMAEASSGLETPNPDPLPPLARVSQIEIDRTRADQFRQFLRKLKIAEEQAGVKVTRRETIQGPTSTFTSVQFFNSFADLDSAAPAGELLGNAFGEAETALLFEGVNAAVRSRDVSTVRYRPDLSRTP